MEDNFSTDGGGVGGCVGDGSGGNARDGERWGAADEASLARPPLTSCPVAWLRTGRKPVEDPCLIHCCFSKTFLCTVKTT